MQRPIPTWRFRLFSVPMLLMATLTSAQADVIVTVPSLSISAGGSGFLDVLISTDGGDSLVGADYSFELTRVSGASDLTISSVTEGPADGLYVFDGTDHFGLEVDFSTPLPGLTFIASDGVGFDPAVMASGARLARINLLHSFGPGGAAAAIGNEFTLTLLDVDGLGDTFFDDGVSLDSLPFSASSTLSGTITISASSAAVPEPSTFFFLAIAVMILCVRSRFNMWADIRNFIASE